MKKESLKQLSARLGLTAAVLRGIQRGEKRSAGQIVANNMAKCLGNIAKRCGYKDKQTAAASIEKDILLLYQSAEKLGARVMKYAEQTRKKQHKEVLEKAASLLLSGNVKGFMRLVSQHSFLAFLKRPVATKIDDALIDSFRSKKKQDKKTAQALLNATGFGGEKILIKASAIKSAVRKRLKRYGVVPSLFWEAAVDFNPKVRVKGVSAAKKKAKPKTRGASAKTARDSKGYQATIEHHLEGESANFKNKLNRIVKQNEEYWAKIAEKEVLAHMYLDKYLGK